MQAQASVMDPTRALVEAGRAGDTQAIASLIRLHAHRLRAACVRLASREDDPEDIFQDTLIEIVRNIGQFRGDSAFMTWATAIARSQANRHRRKRARYRVRDGAISQVATSWPDFMCPGHLDPEDSAAASQIREDVMHALGQLSELDRQVFILRQVEGLTAPEVAGELDLSVSAVKSRLHRARRVVRDAMTTCYPSAA